MRKEIKHWSIAIHFAVLLMVVSCVPARKFTEVETNLKNCNTELDMCKQKQEELGVENAEMKQQLDKQQNQLNSLIKDSMSRSSELEKLSGDYEKVNRQYTELQESQETILKGNARETTKLLTQLQTAQDDLKKKEDALKSASLALDDKRKSLDDLTLELEKRDVRLKELERILFKKDSAVNALKAKINTALKGFDNEDLTVKVKNGKVYVSLEDNLLFKSGSTTVDAKGVEAIKKLGHVLEQNPDINITIEGHTDNVPYKTGGSIKDNWDLSVHRATSIIRILQEESNISPKRLTASGRGEYSPIASNDKPKGKAKNRRTEIILTPKLDELFKILESN